MQLLSGSSPDGLCQFGLGKQVLQLRSQEKLALHQQQVTNDRQTPLSIS
jgi:hypothetical protein